MGGAGLLDWGWCLGQGVGPSCRHWRVASPARGAECLEMKAGNKQGVLGPLSVGHRWGSMIGGAGRGWRDPSSPPLAEVS